MEIVPAEPTDAGALRKLHVRTWEGAYRARASEDWYRERLEAHQVRDWAEFIASHVARGGIVLTARCEGRIVGFCQCGPTEDDDHEAAVVGQIQRLYVHPANQRTGIGQALLMAALGRLREAGAHKATLWVLETDERARGFYEALGWKTDGSRKTGPPADIRYARPLSARLD